MSYCRFSTDSYRCDIYLYEAEGGYALHVAAKRIRAGAPEITGPGDTSEAEIARYIAETKAFNAWLDAAGDTAREPIGGPHDGQSFGLNDLHQVRETLVMLRTAGYRFPDGVLDAVDEDIAAAEDSGEDDADTR